ncbi:hypothetical protein NDU88_002004 [Pleurodeles waltl]|uniref:Uncharacterized protein n=1 Tax=Pleurodeles waltl TaxID=8319 RepID=A0AAV7W0W6_PLEWA|nr:hypothetical protein NDU88_002004 [Pleurodeles waltl]
MAERVTAKERELSATTPSIMVAYNRLNGVEQRLKVLEARAEDTGNRARSNNIRIVGLPEKIEKNDLVGCLEKWIAQELVPEELSPFFAGCRPELLLWERCHAQSWQNCYTFEIVTLDYDELAKTTTW